MLGTNMLIYVRVDVTDDNWTAVAGSPEFERCCDEVSAGEVRVLQYPLSIYSFIHLVPRAARRPFSRTSKLMCTFSCRSIRHVLLVGPGRGSHSALLYEELGESRAAANLTNTLSAPTCIRLSLSLSLSLYGWRELPTICSVYPSRASFLVYPYSGKLSSFHVHK